MSFERRMKCEEALLLVKQYAREFHNWFSYESDREEDPVLTEIYRQFFKSIENVKRVMWSLGFAQGAAYVLKLFSIEEIKKHSQQGYIRPVEPEEAEFVGTAEWASEIVVDEVYSSQEREEGLSLLKQYGDVLHDWFVYDWGNKGDPILTEIYWRFPKETGSINKLTRWVGFIQGAVYGLKLFTIEEIDEHSRECYVEPLVGRKDEKEKQQQEGQQGPNQELG